MIQSRWDSILESMSHAGIGAVVSGLTLSVLGLIAKFTHLADSTSGLYGMLTVTAVLTIVHVIKAYAIRRWFVRILSRRLDKIKAAAEDETLGSD